MTLPLLTSEFSHWKSAVTFVISINANVGCILIHNFYFLNIVLIIMVATFMMSTKLAALGFLQIKLFQNKGYNVIIYVHNVTN